VRVSVRREGEEIFIKNTKTGEQKCRKIKTERRGVND
jgi:hypothetical protein